VVTTFEVLLSQRARLAPSTLAFTDGMAWQTETLGEAVSMLVSTRGLTNFSLTGIGGELVS
jgi:hypothetical protein